MIDRAAEDRAERDRIAAENARRVEAANARREAIAQPPADSEPQASTAKVQADPGRASRGALVSAGAGKRRCDSGARHRFVY